MSQISVIHISRLSGKLVGTSMRSKDLAKAAGLAVVFDLTAHTFYPLSPNVTSIQGRWPCCGLRPQQGVAKR